MIRVLMSCTADHIGPCDDVVGVQTLAPWAVALAIIGCLVVVAAFGWIVWRALR